MREGHLDDFVKERTREFDGFHCIISGQCTNFDKCKLLDIVISNKDIILIAADTRRDPIFGDDVSFFVNCLESAQELLVMFGDFEAWEVEGDLEKIAFLGD